jgi:hypothetical protein
MKITALWDTAPCSLVEVDRSLRGAYCLHHQGDDETIRRYIPEQCNLHTRRRENLTSYLSNVSHSLIN